MDVPCTSQKGTKMAVSLKEFNAIREYIQDQMREYIMKDNAQCTYEDWLNQYKPKREKVQNKQISEDVQRYFEEFWAAFPGTSKFEYNGQRFLGERVLKANKQVCLKLYNDCLIDQDSKRTFTSNPVKDILNALKVQLEHIKIESYKSGQNRMQYMKSCEVYLKHKAYEPWLGQEMPEPVKKEEYSTDIDI